MRLPTAKNLAAVMLCATAATMPVTPRAQGAEPWFMVTPHVRQLHLNACAKLSDPVFFPSFAVSTGFGIRENHRMPGQTLWAVVTEAQLHRFRFESALVAEREMSSRETGVFRDALRREASPPEFPSIPSPIEEILSDAAKNIVAIGSLYNFFASSPNRFQAQQLLTLSQNGGTLRRFVEIVGTDFRYLHDNIILSVSLQGVETNVLVCSSRYALEILPGRHVESTGPMCSADPQRSGEPRLPSLGRHFDALLDRISRGGGYPEACRDGVMRDVGAALNRPGAVEGLRGNLVNELIRAGAPPAAGSLAREDARQAERLVRGNTWVADAVIGREARGAGLADLAMGMASAAIMQRRIVEGATQFSDASVILTQAALANVSPETRELVRTAVEGGQFEAASSALLATTAANPAGEAARLLATFGDPEQAGHQLRGALTLIPLPSLAAQPLDPNAVERARAIYSSLAPAFATYTQAVEASAPGLEDQASRLVAHQERMSQLLVTVAQNPVLGATPEQLRFLVDAASGRLPVVEQLDALRGGILAFQNSAEEAKDALDRLASGQAEAVGALTTLQGAAGSGLAMVNAAAQLARTIDGVFPGAIDENTSSAIANLAENINTAQQVMGVVAALSTPGVGWMAALPVVTGLFGGGGLPGIGGGSAPPAMPPELRAALGRIERSLAQVNQKLDRVIELQQETLARLEQMRLQMTVDRDMITARLDQLIDLTAEGFELLRDDYRAWLRDCRVLVAASVADGSARSFLTLEERQQNMRRSGDSIRSCLNGLSAVRQPGQPDPVGNGGFLATNGDEDQGTLHFRWPFLVLTSDAPQTPEPPSSIQQRLEQAGERRDSGFYRMMADYHLALSATAIPAANVPALASEDHGRCHGRVLALLASAPRYLASLPADDGWACPPSPVLVTEQERLPFAAWRASSSQDPPDAEYSNFEAWRLLEAHLNHDRIAQRVEIVLRAGEWRSLMWMDCPTPNFPAHCRHTVFSRQEAFGLNDASPRRDLWDLESQRTLTDQMADVVSVALARETLVAGGSLIPWVARWAMAPLPAGGALPHGNAFGFQGDMPPLAGGGAPAGTADGDRRAWQILVAARDHADTLAQQRLEFERRGGTWNALLEQNTPIEARLAAWNQSKGLRDDPVTMLDMLRVLAGDPFSSKDGNHRLRAAAGQNAASALRAELVKTFQPIVFGGTGELGLSSVTQEQLTREAAHLEALAWLFPTARGYDLPCRLREVEAVTSLQDREARPDHFRGRTLDSRTTYLSTLRRLLSDPAIARRAASCLIGINPILAENVVRYAVWQRLNDAISEPSWDSGRDILVTYRLGLQEDDGDTLRRVLLPGWPLEQVGSATTGRFWAVRVRTADGRLLRLRLPHPEQLRRGEVTHTPMVEALRSQQARLNEHLIVYGGNDVADVGAAATPLPFAGDVQTRQALARGLALRRVEEQLRTISDSDGAQMRRLDRMTAEPTPQVQ